MTSKTDIKPDLRYTKDHEWARLEGDELTIGITAFAVSELGDITLVTFDVAAGDQVESGAVFGTIESVKTLSDLFSPVKGEVLAVNDTLDDAPEAVNDDCWGAGWMMKLRCESVSDLDQLLDAAGYKSVIEASDG